MSLLVTAWAAAATSATTTTTYLCRKTLMVYRNTTTLTTAESDTDMLDATNATDTGLQANESWRWQ